MTGGMVQNDGGMVQNKTSGCAATCLFVLVCNLGGVGIGFTILQALQLQITYHAHQCRNFL